MRHNCQSSSLLDSMIFLFFPEPEPYKGDIDDYFSNLIFSTKADYLFLSYSSLIFAASFSVLFCYSSFKAIGACSSLSFSILFSNSSYSFICNSCSLTTFMSSSYLQFKQIYFSLTGELLCIRMNYEPFL